MTDSSVEAVARAVQLWWMTQKHEPMHQNDALDLARAAIAGLPSPEREPMRDALVRAYREGAKDVHDFLAKMPDGERQMLLRDDCPDLTEAAHTYADAALANPATIRDTDEDAVEADMRAYAEAAMQHGWKTAVDAAANGRLVGGWERDWFEQNPPKCARLASSTPAEPGEGSLTLDNASVQRLMDYGLLHHTDKGWIVGEWKDAVAADNPPAEPDEPTAEGNYDERN